ncbi:MAG: hypothetical protein NTX34_10120 [Cytophagales bacterium]|nr:hypothetical protein [Cytophagales bacterium]
MSSFTISAQDWNYQMGINSSNFNYISPSGIAQNSFQPDAGLHLSVQRSNRLIDTAKTHSHFLRKLDYQVGLSINQFNSLGETQNIPFSYSSTYVGLQLGIGMKSRLGRGFSLHYRSLVQLHKLLVGSQKMGNQVFNLQANKQFDRILFQLGGEVKLAKQVNSQTALFAYLSNSWQLNSIQQDGSDFAINPMSFGFGIHYSPLK